MSRWLRWCSLVVFAGSIHGANPVFTQAGGEFRFDTGALKGSLRQAGRSIGLLPVADTVSGAALARSMGLLSPYRMLTADRRFGEAAWDWPSVAALEADGSVRVTWSADAVHPFSMTGVYRWASSNALDLSLTVTPTQALKGFEVFVSAYFEGFGSAFGYAAGALLEATQSDAAWHMFPRDDAATALIRDGRWRLPPHPVEWVIRPNFTGALAVRRDARTGLVGVLMAPTSDCFAIAMPHGAEAHRSLYLSLFGRDVKVGESATARARLVVAHDLADVALLDMYRSYQQGGGEK